MAKKDRRLIMEQLRPDQQRIVQEARENGLFASLSSAADRQLNGLPQDMERFYLTFLRQAKDVPEVSRALYQLCVNEFPDGRLGFRFLRGIYAVVVDGMLMKFIPIIEVRQINFKKRGSAQRRRHTAFVNDPLRRSKHALIPQSAGIFREAMRGQCVGLNGARHTRTPDPLIRKR